MTEETLNTKSKLLWTLIFVLFSLMGIAGLAGLRANRTCPFYVSHDNKRQCIVLDRAATSAERQQGLSRVNSILPSQGMLFVFDQPEPACMWMKDMKFSLDMIWLDTDKRITKIAENVSPDTYPRSFCSNNPAKYVIEVNAGVASQANLSLDQHLHL